MHLQYNLSMPAHDWSRVTAGTFHSFHVGWIAELTRTLNGGLLPEDYYALSEQRASEFEPDLLTLEHREPQAEDDELPAGNGSGTAVATEAFLYAMKRRTVAIRHATNDRIVALLEIVSPGNKDRPQSVQRLVNKAVAALQSGYHLVVVDVLPPGPSDPAGMGEAVWDEIGGKPLAWPADKPLSAASFRVADRVYCYADAFSVGQTVPDVSLFYDPDWYVTLSLEATYAAAYAGVPRRWRRVIEGAA